MQFFHEADEVGVWMLRDLKKLNDSFDVSDLKGNYADAKRLLQELDVSVHGFSAAIYVPFMRRPNL